MVRVRSIMAPDFAYRMCPVIGKYRSFNRVNESSGFATRRCPTRNVRAGFESGRPPRQALPRAFFFHSSHGRAIVPAIFGSYSFPSSGAM